VLNTLDSLATTYQFNSPFIPLTELTFRLRSGLLGLSNSLDDNLAFRAWLEAHIVQRLEDLPVMQDYAQLSSSTHFGPAIVIPLATENTGNNFFGNPPEVPFGGDRFPISRNAKILRYAMRFDGVDAFALGGSNNVSIFLMPIGDSVIRENTNQPVVEDEPARSWSVVDQWLPLPPLVFGTDPVVQDRDYNPWVETAGSGCELPQRGEAIPRVDRADRSRTGAGLSSRSRGSLRLEHRMAVGHPRRAVDRELRSRRDPRQADDLHLRRRRRSRKQPRHHRHPVDRLGLRKLRVLSVKEAWFLKNVGTGVWYGRLPRSRLHGRAIVASQACGSWSLS
jgi:hypothetical protein